ncbi:REP-associated tyrosine transposase [Hirschia litorea]|uniref:Transposase n=1 Tax=Hirschia litorea TaxID=1199156 RepID=A0ABW2ILM4_9PROT
MPNYRRLHVPGGTYFFTVNLANRRARLLVDHIHALRAAWKQTQNERPFETIAVCVLPEHLHCIWQLPGDDDDFATRWRLIKSRFSKALPTTCDTEKNRRKGERGIWQRRFWEHAIRDDKDLNNHINYIHYNPVKHGLVEDMDAWPYSSWHRFKESYGKEWQPPSFPTKNTFGEPD